MKTKHTAGPWHTGGTDGRIVYAADGFAVADATVFHGRHAGEHQHNAALMAASPAMLEALREAEEQLRNAARFMPTRAGAGVVLLMCDGYRRVLSEATQQ